MARAKQEVQNRRQSIEKTTYPLRQGDQRAMNSKDINPRKQLRVARKPLKNTMSLKIGQKHVFLK